MDCFAGLLPEHAVAERLRTSNHGIAHVFRGGEPFDLYVALIGNRNVVDLRPLPPEGRTRLQAGS